MLVAACIVVLSACATTPPKYTGPVIPPQKELVLHAGDVLDVKFAYWPELNEQQAIRSDGKLSAAAYRRGGRGGLDAGAAPRSSA